MISRGSTFRTLAIWSLVPYALWSAMPATVCRCATGEFRLFCPHALRALRSSAVQRPAPGSAASCCCCRKAAAHWNRPAIDDGWRGNQSSEQKCCGHCRSIVAGPIFSNRTDARSGTKTVCLFADLMTPCSTGAFSAMCFRRSRACSAENSRIACDLIVVLHCFRI